MRILKGSKQEAGLDGVMHRRSSPSYRQRSNAVQTEMLAMTQF